MSYELFYSCFSRHNKYKDKQTNKVFGAVIAGDFALDYSPIFQDVGEKFKPIFELFERLKTQHQQDIDIQLGEYLHCYILAVSPQRRGEKIAQNLIQTCLENGMIKGYCMAFTEAANSISQHVFRKLGFVDCHEILSQQFTFQGEHVFASIEGQTGTILMDKALV